MNLASCTGRNPDPQKPPRWQEWSDGVNGHVYRFLSCEEHFQEVNRSLSTDTAPPQPERYNQEKWLFGFFYEGLSSLECLYYAMYFIGTHVDPTTFSLSVNRRQLTPSFVANQFDSAFSSDALTQELAVVINENDYMDWSEIRNILSHRGHGSRTVYAGGGRTGQVDWNLPISQSQVTTILQLAELQRRRMWLGEAVTRIVKAAYTFGTTKIP